MLKHLEKQLSNSRQFLMGDEMTIADLVMFNFIINFVSMSDLKTSASQVFTEIKTQEILKSGEMYVLKLFQFFPR